ncbi:MAG: magnesium chelatase, partial [Lachnospiraceae bacterium]|nr:magnesium chelatase [Lachnospiraceae bacterium]
MFSTIISGSIQGIHSHLIQVEADVSTGLPVFNMVGLLSTEVRESCERVKVALRNSGLSLSPMHITINLSPANIRKSGTGLDLPIALAILCATGHLNEADLENTLVLGEL